MAQKMMDYIRQQPGLWKKILEEREKSFAAFGEAVSAKAGKILLTGSGSSFFAAEAAAEVFEEVLGIEARAAVPGEAERHLAFFRPGELLVIAVSQSGRSNSTRNLMRRIRERGHFVVGVTAGEKEKTGGDADFHQLIACGEETVGPKTKGMSATVLTLYLMGMKLAEVRGLCCGEAYARRAALLRALEQAVSAASYNLEVSEEFAARHAALLAKQPHFTLICGAGGYAAAKEGALKLLETLYVPASAYQLEEYTHGIQNTMGPDACNIFLAQEQREQDAVERLERYGREHGCRHLVVTTLPWRDEGEHILKLRGSGSPYAAVFEMLPAVQMMGAYGSEYKNIECDMPKFKDFYTVMNTKSNENGR